MDVSAGRFSELGVAVSAAHDVGVAWSDAICGARFVFKFGQEHGAEMGGFQISGCCGLGVWEYGV